MNKSIAIIPFLDIKNAYVVISCHENGDTGNGIKKNMSFFYGDENYGAEWEPDSGPITQITKCDKNHENAQKHWFFEYCTGYANWMQLIVDEEQLPYHFLNGNFDIIFDVLKHYSQ